MAQVTKNIFKGQTAALYADNVAGGISAADLRAQMDDIADSAGFTSSGNTVAPTSGDDTFDIGDVWVDETANTISQANSRKKNDQTKFKFDGKILPKNQYVYSVVTNYLKENPQLTLEQFKNSVFAKKTILKWGKLKKCNNDRGKKKKKKK